MSQGIAGTMVGSDAKICLGCGETKPLGAYYTNRGGLAGRQSRCKPCFRKQLTARSDYRRIQNARNAVRLAIKSGALVRADACECCGESGYTHGHHDDYDHPLVVRWLCPPCHENEHRGSTYERHPFP